MCEPTNFDPVGWTYQTFFVSDETFEQRVTRLRPAPDDILYSREGGILGVACRVPPYIDLCMGQRMMLIRAGKSITPPFLELVLNSPMITSIARRNTTGGAAPRINVSTVKAYPIPVPPVAEQRHIVAKVAELIAACDRLEATLASTQNMRNGLLESVLTKALEDTATSIEPPIEALP